MSLLIQWINILANLIILLVVVEAILSFFLSPFHPVRHALGEQGVLQGLGEKPVHRRHRVGDRIGLV